MTQIEPDGNYRLFERRQIPLVTPAEASLGMAVNSRDGQAEGYVAAIVTDTGGQHVTHLLITGTRRRRYRLVPIAAINYINQGIVWLKLDRATVAQLPDHRPAQLMATEGRQSV